MSSEKGVETGLLAWELEYSDGCGNRTTVWTEEDGIVRWRYSPMMPETSSSGAYSGGEADAGFTCVGPASRLCDAVGKLEAWELTEDQSSGRAMGTGLCNFRRGPAGSEPRRFLLPMNAPYKGVLEGALQNCMQDFGFEKQLDPEFRCSGLVTETDDALARGARWELRWPAPSRDAACLRLFNDSASMMPELPFLYGMSAEALKRRRDTQRRGFVNGTSFFLDIVAPGSNDLLGVTGLREIHHPTDGSERRRAEWGVAIDASHRRAGTCTQVFDACWQWCTGPLDIEVMTASTETSNTVMRDFLQRKGMAWSRRHENSGYVWEEYMIARASTPPYG